jgi:predicted SAM-dependent methyltransferase
MRKVHLGCGQRSYDEWENYDRNVDMTKPLPFEDNSIDYFFTNHALEHINIKQGYSLLKEMYRCLKTGGVARMQIPDVHRIYHYAELIPDYIQERANGDLVKVIENVMFDFEHEVVYTEQLLDTVMKLAGFNTMTCNQNKSMFPEMQTVLDGHKKCNIYRVETTCIEGVK